jgi:proteasome lid subunit RPN8/RPN11
VVKRASENLPSPEDWAAAKRDATSHGTGPGLPTAPISAALLQELIDAARAGVPNESCGLLVSDAVFAEGGVAMRYVPLRNAAESPYRYLIDPDEQLRAFIELDEHDEIVWAIVHSHVASPAVPSATDVGLAFYPDALYVIVSLADDKSPSVRAWSIREGSVSEVALVVTA